MKSWILSISAVIVLTSVLSFVIPDGKMKKPIESVFSLLTIIAIISPLFRIDFSNFSFFGEEGGEQIYYQESFLDYVSAKIKQENINECNFILEELGIKNCKIDIAYSSTDNYKITTIRINLVNSVIISQNEHIDIIAKAKDDISKYFQIEKEMVFFINNNGNW